MITDSAPQKSPVNLNYKTETEIEDNRTGKRYVIIGNMTITENELLSVFASAIIAAARRRAKLDHGIPLDSVSIHNLAITESTPNSLRIQIC
jgi:hypothetical protein